MSNKFKILATYNGRSFFLNFILLFFFLGTSNTSICQNTQPFDSKKVWTIKVDPKASREVKKKFDGKKIREGVITPLFELNNNQYISVLFKEKKMHWFVTDLKGNKIPDSKIVYKRAQNNNEGLGERTCMQQYDACLSRCGNSISPDAWFCNIECAADLTACFAKKFDFAGQIGLF